MDKFYIIKLFNSHTGSRGYVLETPKGIMISDSLVADTKQFVEQSDATKYIRANKLERKGVTALIMSNEELLEKQEGVKPLKESEVYTVMNLQGQYVFFESGTQSYYFADRDTGYCVWYDKDAIEKFIDIMAFPHQTLIKKIR